MDEARQTLHELRRIRRETRAALDSLWFPLVVFGALTLVSSVVFTVAGPQAFGGLYWPVAGVAGGAVTAWYYSRREGSIGVGAAAAPHAATGAAILIGTLGLGWGGALLGLPIVSAAGPSLVVAAGFLAFAYLERSAALAGIAVGLATMTLTLVAVGLDASRLTAVGTATYGAAFLVTGLAHRLLWLDDRA